MELNSILLKKLLTNIESPYKTQGYITAINLELLQDDPEYDTFSPELKTFIDSEATRHYNKAKVGRNPTDK